MGIGLAFPANLSAHARWARFLVLGLWSRRLTEPPRPMRRGGRKTLLADGGQRPIRRLCMRYHQKAPSAEGAQKAPTRTKKSDGNSHRIFDVLLTHAACPRRLCQPPWTQPSLSEPRPLSGGTKHEEVDTSNASRSSGEGVWGRGASLREAASPPESPPAYPIISPLALNKGSFSR